MAAGESGVGVTHLRRHLLRVQRRHVIVLLERVGEDLPVAVVVRDPFVAFGQLVERVAVQPGDHRAEELAQALSRLGIEVDEDEPIPHVAVHRGQSVPGRVEVEELRGLLHIGERAVQAVAPAVVLAGELPAGAACLFVRKVVPHQFVSAMPTDVVEGPDLLVAALDQDDGDAGDLDLLGQIATGPRQLLDAGHVQPRPLEDRLTFQLVEFGRRGIGERDRPRAQFGIVLGPGTLGRPALSRHW